MAAKHSPGPWTPEWDVDRHSRLDCIACVEHHIFDAVDIYAPQVSATVEEHEANVRLIAAAPEMAEALREYMEWGAMTGSDRDLFDQRFRALLARIDGEQA